MVKFCNVAGLAKNSCGFRTNHTCELCGFEPRTKNKYREKQDHLVMKHFKERIDKIFPHCRPYQCPYDDCAFTGKDKQALLRHYTGKHGILEQFLREALAEKGIDYADEHPKRKNSSDSRNGKKSPQALGLSTAIPLDPKDLLPTSPVPIATTSASSIPPRANTEELRLEVEALMASLQPQPVKNQNGTLMQVNLPQVPDPIVNGSLSTRLTNMANGIINGTHQVNGSRMSINNPNSIETTSNCRTIITMAETNCTNGVVNVCNSNSLAMSTNGTIANGIGDKMMHTTNGSNGHILNVGNVIPTTISLPTIPISKVYNTTPNLPINPLPPMSVNLPKEPTTFVVSTSNANGSMNVRIPPIIAGHNIANSTPNIPTIISESYGGNSMDTTSNHISGNPNHQTVNLMRRTSTNGNLPTSNILITSASTANSMPILKASLVTNNSSVKSCSTLPKLPSILSTALPSTGIPTVISMSDDDAGTMPSLQQQISLPAATSANNPLPMDVVSKLTCSLPSSVSNANSGMNGLTGLNGLIVPVLQHNTQPELSSSPKPNYVNSPADISAEAAEAAAEVIEQSAKNVLENEEVMWGAPHGGPAVVVEIADTVPVTYIEANGDIMGTKYQMSINGVGGPASAIGQGVPSVTTLDHIDYDYLCAVTHNETPIRERQLDFCML